MLHIVYLYLETVTVFKISNTSIRGKEELVRTELESMGSLQGFLSHQSKFHFVLKIHGFYPITPYSALAHKSSPNVSRLS